VAVPVQHLEHLPFPLLELKAPGDRLRVASLARSSGVGASDSLFFPLE
jgi:hypothetical protein